MTDPVIVMLVVGLAFLVVLAVAVTAADLVGAGAWRERAAARRDAWETARGARQA